uniref:Uncharacterized protein n=1 Tax=Arundo donax TaxID=35708 RepID=A0A0A8YR94_ARUDO
MVEYQRVHPAVVLLELG